MKNLFRSVSESENAGKFVFRETIKGSRKLLDVLKTKELEQTKLERKNLLAKEILPNQQPDTPKVKIEKNIGRGTISIGDKWFRIYHLKNGGMRYQSSKDRTVHTLNFKNKDDLAKKLGPILNKVFGSNRPNLRKQVDQIYDALDLVPTGSVPQSSETQDDERVSYKIEDSKNAILKIDGKVIKIKKLKRGIEYSIGNDNPKKLYFKSLQDLRIKFGKWLDHEIGTISSGKRPNVRNELDMIYKELKLKESIGAELQGEEREGIEHHETVLDLPVGKYRLERNNLPAIYLLVRCENKYGFYCLSFVQEAFDMIYGMKKAREAGLYSKRAHSPRIIAQDLNFGGRDVTVENYNKEKHKNLKRGTIVRLSKGGGMTHIGIVLEGGKIAHSILNTFYIDEITSISEGWYPQQIITPGSSFEEKEIETKTFSEIFEKGRSLEAITPFLRKNLPKIKTYNSATIEEIIYQLNKDKFKIMRYRETVAELKKDTKLIIPKEWFENT